MNKIFLALTILAAGTTGFLAAHQSTIRLQREASATRESWMVQTQALADAQGEGARLAGRIRELKQNLSQAEAAGNLNDLWSVLETNRIGHLAPELREHLLEELGFNWNSSEAFIVVSKETVHGLRNRQASLIRWNESGNPEGKPQGQLVDCIAALLALTPEERRQIETAMERVWADLKDWAISHTERSEPRDDVLAEYTLQSAPPTSITNNFTEVFSVIGKERTQLLMIGSWQDHYRGSIPDWVVDIGMSDKPITMIIKRFSDGNKQVLKARVFTSNGTKDKEDVKWDDEFSNRYFPGAFRPLFPNGWADVAEREGFELPDKTEHK